MVMFCYSNICYYVTWNARVQISYSLIAFDERVTFLLQRALALPCVCVHMLHYLCVRLACNHYAIVMVTCEHKAVTGHVVAIKLLSRQRQSDYRRLYGPCISSVMLNME